MSDLLQVTAKKIRNALEALFAVDLLPRKKEFSELIMKRYDLLLEKNKSKPSGEDEQKDAIMAAELHALLNAKHLRKTPKLQRQKKRRKRVDGEASKGTGLHKLLQLSPELSQFLGVDQLERTQIVKRVWQYIREHSLQDPNDGRNILCDEKMEPIFGKSVTIFTMHKAISKHVHGIDANETKPKDETK